MGPFSKKSDEQQVAQTDSPSANVSNDTSSTTTTAPVTPTEPVVKKEKHSRAFSFVSVLFLLMLLVAGVMTYLWYDQKGQAESLQSEIDGAEQTVTNLRTELAKNNGLNPTTPVTADTKSNEDLIKESVITYQHAYKVSEKAQFNVSVTKMEGEFAWASFSSVPPEGGAKCLLKKVDGTWLVLFCGQSVPMQSSLDAWGVPKSFATGAN